MFKPWTKRAGFTPVGTLLLFVGMSLPMIALAVAFVAAALKWREDKKLKEQEDRFQKTLQAIPESWFENKGDAV